MYQSITNYKGGRYFWVATILSLASALAYYMHQPINSANGGTWLGYTLGTIGALLIVWLMLLGVRKRSYSSNMGTVQGWTSAHVYLGTALLLIATLHCGLQFGSNIHTLAYVLMVIVILSGFFGIYTYIRYPNLMTSNRSGETLDGLLEQIQKIDDRCIKDAKGANLSELIESAVLGCSIGGSWWQQLRSSDTSTMQLPGGPKGKSVENKNQERIITVLAERLSQTQNSTESGLIQSLLANFAAKQTLLSRIRRDVQIRGLLKVWLYFHVPLSFGLLAALSVHIIVVFYYW
ncbi:hypothetical protein NBRC116583_27260 [Arenicella sp. 4NH20-0111]|uniref:hypothetical protein n=1 Tax=Arenicella sp. 4NH20-0111 TaxID=3127648 RepID=UPI003105E73B